MQVGCVYACVGEVCVWLGGYVPCMCPCVCVSVYACAGVSVWVVYCMFVCV